MSSASRRFSGPLTESHDITACYGSWGHCYVHNVDEYPPEPYRICFECRHAFPSAQALLDDNNAVTRAMNAEAEAKGWAPPGNIWELSEPIPDETDPAKVYCCPHCIHDF